MLLLDLFTYIILLYLLRACLEVCSRPIYLLIILSLFSLYQEHVLGGGGAPVRLVCFVVLSLFALLRVRPEGCSRPVCLLSSCYPYFPLSRACPGVLSPCKKDLQTISPPAAFRQIHSQHTKPLLTNLARPQIPPSPYAEGLQQFEGGYFVQGTEIRRNATHDLRQGGAGNG